MAKDEQERPLPARSEEEASAALAAGGIEAERPGAIPLRGWWAVLRRTIKRIDEERLWIEAAGVAFFGLFSLFPALVATVTTYGLFADPELVEAHLAAVRDFLPPAAYSLLEERLGALVAESSTSLGLGLAISLAVAFWGASRGMNTLLLVSGHAYREKDERNFLQRTALSFVFTIGGACLLLFAVLTLGALPGILALLQLESGTRLIVDAIRWPLLAGAILTGISCLYWFAPHRRLARRRWVLPGAMIATFAWLIFSLGFSLYVELVPSIGADFGSMSAIAVLMLWMYYSVMVVVVGALLNAELEYQTRRDTTVGPERPMGRRGAFVADNVPSGGPAASASGGAAGSAEEPSGR